MPVVTTMIAVALFGGGDEPLPFFDPYHLRDLLEDTLDDDAETLGAALAIVDEMDRALTTYRENVDASVDAYIENFGGTEPSVTELIGRLQPLDQAREKMLLDIIERRDELAELLGPARWARVFA